MLKPITELFDNDLKTIKDLINVLMKVPKDYTLYSFGRKYQMEVNHVNGCVYLGNPNCIGQHTNETTENAEKEGVPTEIDVPDKKLATYQNQVYVVMGYSDVCKNGNYEGTLQGVFSTPELAQECGDELVEAKEISYYDIECPLIDEFGFK